MSAHVRALSSVLVIVFANLLGYVLVPLGCASAVKVVDEVNDPKDDLALKQCRQAMREARDAGASPEDAFKTYYDCTVDAGFR